jgi:hypothetical protein
MIQCSVSDISPIPLKMSTFVVKHAADCCSINPIFVKGHKMLGCLFEKQSVLFVVKSMFMHIIRRILDIKELSFATRNNIS